MEHLDVSDDDDDSEEGFDEDSQMKVSEIAHESFSYKSRNDPASVLPVAEGDSLAMESSSEAKECVLCKRKVWDIYIVSLLTSQMKIIEGCL